MEQSLLEGASVRWRAGPEWIDPAAGLGSALTSATLPMQVAGTMEESRGGAARASNAKARYDDLEVSLARSASLTACHERRPRVDAAPLELDHCGPGCSG